MTGELRISFKQRDGEMVGRCWCGWTVTGAHPHELWELLDEHAREHDG